MASAHVFVLDSSFKRTQIKVTPGKYLREILEEACLSKKLNPESYMLKTQNNKIVDLSQPFRLSGLSAGAKLQLTQASRSPSIVNVALQLPESEGGGRLSDKFPSTTSLWLILRKCEDAVAGQSSQKLNLTQRAVPQNVGSGAGRLEYEQPCLHLMGRNMETFTDLQKTLAQLGLNSGSVLIRLTFRNTGQPLEEAMQNIDQYFRDIDSVPAGIGSSASREAHAVPATQMQSQQDILGANTATTIAGSNNSEPIEGQEVSMKDISTINNHDTSSDAPVSANEAVAAQSPEHSQQTVNGMTVFRPPSSSTPAAALHEDDPSIYEPSVDQAKAHQASLLRSTRNQRLLSDKELEEQDAERQAALALVKIVTVRVRYPDQSIIETTIDATETSAGLYAKVMDTLAAAPEPFELRYTGGRGHQTLPNSSSQRLVRDFGFKGKVLLTLVWSADASLKARQGPSLKDEYRSHAQELKVELVAQQAAAEDSHRTAMGQKEPTSSDSGSGKGKGDLEAKMKKFLGFGKK